MTRPLIHFGRPMIDDAERNAVNDVLLGTTFVHGPASKAFEEAFADRMGVAHAISLSSCTAGLHLSLFVQGVGPGNRVAVPAMTHVATAHAVEYCGAEPVFVDVQPENGNICPDALEAVADDLSAIMVVHYLGLPCDMDRISSIAKAIGAFVIEDCALAVDATYDGRKTGTFGRAGCFSFYPIKHMTTLEGGMLTTNDEALATSIRQRKAFGYDRTLGERTKPGIYDVTALGYNYRMNEVQAAVGMVQLGKLDGFQAARAENYRIIHSALAEVDEITIFDPVQGKAKSSHYCLNVVLPRDGSIDRDAIVVALKEKGVGSSVHYPSAVPLFSYYREKYGYTPGTFPIAEWLADQTISLPVGPHVTPEDAAYIASAVKEALSKAR
ncbi:MAG: DegT/DnrJ/EryC1/StrS aminotransferase family protein [Rhodospirillales bacterium]|nr:DegT/DnrJ/EryC1/StrS aminotransferase family protein [Rhodospirillales bacterium]